MLSEQHTALIFDIDGTLFIPDNGKRKELAYYVLKGGLKNRKRFVTELGIIETAKRIFYANMLLGASLTEKVLRNRYRCQVKIFNKITKNLNSELMDLLEKGGADFSQNIPRDYINKILSSCCADIYFNSAEPKNIQELIADYLEIKPVKYFQPLSMGEKIRNTLHIAEKYKNTLWVDDHAPKIKGVTCLNSIYELPAYVNHYKVVKTI